MLPVRRADGAAAQRRRRRVHLRVAQQLQHHRRAADVHDGVHRAHLVEVDLARSDTPCTFASASPMARNTASARSFARGGSVGAASISWRMSA